MNTSMGLVNALKERIEQLLMGSNLSVLNITVERYGMYVCKGAIAKESKQCMLT